MAKLTKPILIAIVAGLLLLAVGVVAAVVGLAIYGHNQAFIAGNEEAATMNVKTISRAQIQYYTEHGNFGTFDQLAETRLLSQRFAGAMPIVNGYVYDLKVRPASASQKSTFTLNADPESATTGNKHFFINETNSIIHVNRDRPANAGDPPHVR
jgi:Tfp pilus assembly protein PilE